jgi:hypothetical protein
VNSPSGPPRRLQAFVKRVSSAVGHN